MRVGVVSELKRGGGGFETAPVVVTGYCWYYGFKCKLGHKFLSIFFP